jgi:group I intron endonuclease
MVEGQFVVYKHTCLVTGKSYVGITPKRAIPTLTPEELMLRRWKSHLQSAKKGSTLIFHRAITKYGSESFTHAILEVCDSLTHVLQREIFWINECKTLVDDGGYNMTRGGEGNLMPESIKQTHRKRTSEGTKKAFTRIDVKERWQHAMTLVNADPLTQKKRSISQSIAQNRCDTQQKRKQTLQEFWRINQALLRRRCRQIQQLNAQTGEVIATYLSARDAARTLCLSQGAISNAARGLTKSSGGFRWAYVDVNEEIVKNEDI